MKSNLKRRIISHAANIIGWKTNRKIVTILSDDWGSIHTYSKQARDILNKRGLNLIKDRFDYYDALENESDLVGLFEVLSSVKDKYGKSAIMTPYTIVTNPDFDEIERNKFERYIYEFLPQTYQRLPGYENVWALWKEGIEKKLFMPQFHGREHLNINIMMEGLRKGNNQMLECFKYRSWAGIDNAPQYLSTYSFQKPDENGEHILDLKDGVGIFENIFNYKAEHFVPPQGKYNRILEPTLKDIGIDFIDVPRIKFEPQFDGSSKKIFTYLGMRNPSRQNYIVRNCMFENSNSSKLDWVDFCLNSVDAAFRMRSPAIITSHRVNFIGQIEPSNRDKGLKGLKKLLDTIIKKWPDVEFLSLKELGNLIK